MLPRVTPSLIVACCLMLAVPTIAPVTSAAASPTAAIATGAAPAGTEDSVRSRVTATAVSVAAANARIRSVLPKRAKGKGLGKRFTMTVWDPATGRYIYRKRSTSALRGASTTKILTSVAALHTMGAAHRLPTTVKTGARPGELVLVGGGDPLLRSANLRALARSTAKALATPTAGTVITVRADDSLFAGSGISRGWASRWVPSQVRPVGPFARDDRATRNPTADAGRYFAAALRKAGLKATYTGEAKASARARTIATFAGHTVGQSVSRALLVSDNDTAEMLLRLVAIAKNQPSTWAGARAAMARTLRELGVPLRKVRVIDGSGLSLDGRVTAGALTAALSAALSPKHPELAPLRSYLPVAGRTGTLKAASKRFTSKPARCAAGRIQAKTGTLADAVALAGYAAGADGRPKVFVAIVNNRPTKYTRLQTRKAVDKVSASITGCW